MSVKTYIRINKHITIERIYAKQFIDLGSNEDVVAVILFRNLGLFISPLTSLRTQY